MKSKTKKVQTDNLDADEVWKIAWTYISTVVDTVREPFLVLDQDLRVLSANTRFYKIFQVVEKETKGKLVYDLGNGQWDIPKLRELLDNIIPKHTHFEDFTVEHNFQKIGHKTMILNARRVFSDRFDKPILLLAMEDITHQLTLEDESRSYTKRLTVEVSKRTSELELRVKELERINKVMVNRELKMIELKTEIQRLKKAS